MFCKRINFRTHQRTHIDENTEWKEWKSLLLKVTLQQASWYKGKPYECRVEKILIKSKISTEVSEIKQETT